MKKNVYGISQKDMDLMASFEDLIARKEYVEDFIDSFQPDELAQMVREGIITLPEIEMALRRKQGL